MILRAQEYLGRQILSLLTAERAGDSDRLERKIADTARHVAAASLAGDNKLLSVWRQKSHEQSNHRRTQGESPWCKKKFGHSQTGEI
jgi:hypothetical protein